MNADELARELRGLGLQAGTTVLAHASLRALGRVDGGAKAVIGALRHVLGPAGTLVVATTTAANSDSSRNHLATIDGMTLSEVRAYRATMPPYDRAVTPAETGQIAEEIRTNPDAIRSAHPQSSFAAIGPLASALMRDHRIGCHLGEDSPGSCCSESSTSPARRCIWPNTATSQSRHDKSTGASLSTEGSRSGVLTVMLSLMTLISRLSA
jgi:aminoglycoside 3-N-acetyltransferase